MVDRAQQFEIKDTSGTTKQFAGTAVLSSVSVPPSPGDMISEILLRNLTSNPSSRLVYVSFDAGVSWTSVDQGDALSWSPKGVTQVQIKGSHSAGTAWEAVFNFEEP